jgi:hypothetical protein
VLRNQGKLAEAELLCREALAMSRRLLGNENKIEFVSFNELNLLLLRQGKLAEIEALFSDRLQGLQERLPADDAKIIGALGDLNRILVLEGKFPEAEQRTRESLGLLETKLPDDWRTFNSRSLLGGSLLGQKKYDDAEPYLLTGYQGMKQREDKIPDAGKPYFKEALQRLVQLYQATGRPDQAAEWKHKLEAFDPPAPATNSVVDAKQR